MIYAALLAIFVAWGVVALAIGDSVVSLFKILGLVATPILAIGAFQIFRVNMRFLPAEIRPPVWRRACLLLCGVIYAILAVVCIPIQIMTMLGYK